MRRCLGWSCLLILAGCAGDDRSPPVATAAPACFWPSQVSGFSDSGPDTAVVRIGTRERWALDLSRGCPDVDWALAIAIRPRGGQAICPGRPAEIFVPDASGRGGRTCLVTSVRRLPDQPKP
ncbi:hypothetical protein ASE86_05580 [Sphingomonas sp. Leaf33]|uniref:DUF6491 family protein n=1 Tax=Sphingomonas sp. Leaf33 TaxID=1736215 RepID=UPI0006FB7873|nr:DUF6491 family protein [Sphingomonas sp. Leaf33]KQN25679.1 hypothetical protein ASE86_05580 [Sphingomonas sp. Leaf33]